MFKNKIFAFLLLFGLSIYSQEEPNLPNLTPPSPEAFAMTKYGDVNLNENSGFVVQEIPLYEYSAGNLKLPISINYQGAGVKVDDTPSWTGINWTLNAGGVITRIVKDIPDEKTTHRVMITDSELNNFYLNNYDASDVGYFLNTRINNPQYDTEADLFNFSFAGFSGSFFLDENKIPRILNCKYQLKIELEINDLTINQITFTTSEGVKYYFGGVLATEQTVRRYVVNGSITPNDTNEGATAFYLTKIEHPNQGNIYFEYIQDIESKRFTTQKTMSASYEIERFDPTISNCSIPGGEPSNMTISTLVISPKFIKRIYSDNNYEVNFESESLTSSYFCRVLKKIVVKKTLSAEIIKSIDFKYINLSNQNRFFLERIEFDRDLTSSGNHFSDNYYRFVYNEPSALPAKFSYSQDFLGYFNGITNPNLLPDNLRLNPNQIPGIYANRTPNFEYASKGVLTHIYYPTKGYTLYEYEPLKAKKRRYKTLNLFAYRNKIEYIPSTKISDGVPQMNPDNTEYGLPIMIENNIAKIAITLQATDSPTSIIPQQEKGYLRVYDITNGMTATPFVEELVAMPSPTSGSQEVQTILARFNFDVPFSAGRKYKVVFELYNDGNPYNTQTPMEANISITYFDGIDIVDNFGVRVKRTTNFSKDNKPESIKRIYYRTTKDQINNIDNLEFLTENLPIKEEISFHNNYCDIGLNALVAGHKVIGTISSEKIDISNAPNVGNYEVVSISYGGDNYEQGGVEKQFRKFTDYSAFLIPAKRVTDNIPYSAGMHYNINPFESFSERNTLNGELLRETFLIKKNNVVEKNKETFYDYKFENIKKINNLKGQRNFDAIYYFAPITMSNVVTNHAIVSYPSMSMRNELEKKTEIEYLDPIDIDSTYNSTTNLKFVSETEYKYSPDLIGVPNEITTTTSQGDLKKVKSFYPINSDLTHLNDAPTNYYNNYVALKDKHILSKPVQVETYLDSTLISKNRTLYKTWSSNPSSIYPEIIQASKGNGTLEDRIVFHEYSGSNPKIVSYKDGSKTKYLYNSDQKVIAKIENYVPGAGGEIDENNTSGYSPCANLNVNTNVTTLYTYDPVTKLLIEVKDPNCKSTYYIYDELHRLKQIKDNQNKVIKEFDTNYRPN